MLSKKYLKQKRARSVAQVVEYLPSECKALGSNPQYCKKKKKGRKGREEKQCDLFWLLQSTAWHTYQAVICLSNLILVRCF
jgi:hypothetical protein